jgi:hypothetical protein
METGANCGNSVDFAQCVRYAQPSAYASRTHWAKSTTGRGLETEIEIRHIMATTSLKRTTSCTPIMDRNELDLKLEERLRDLREQLRHLEMSREIDRKLLDLKVSI